MDNRKDVGKHHETSALLLAQPVVAQPEITVRRFAIIVVPLMALAVHSVRAGHSMRNHFVRAGQSMRNLTLKQALQVFMSLSLVIFGNVGQLLALNLWLVTFGPYGGPFTVLTLSASTIAAFYGVVLSIWLVVTGHSIRFLWNPVSLALIVGIGLCNATNGVALVFATGETPEVLQAFLLSSQLIWIFLFVKIGFHEKRNYFSPLVLTAFFFCLGGICVGLASQFSGSTPYTKDAIYWSIIFAGGMIPGALYNVVAAKFLRRYTNTTSSLPAPRRQGFMPTPQVAAVPLNHDVEPASPASPASAVYDGLTVKIVMLFTSGVAQAAWMFVLLPMDALPWFGTNPGNIKGTGKSLREGYECVFTSKFEPSNCKDAFWYNIFFNVSYMLNYVGTAWLNMYSPALTSIVTQLSSPVAAIVLILFPVFNTSNTPYNIGESVGAVILLTLGTLVYSAWEESTKQEERDAKQSLPNANEPAPAPL